MDLVYEVNMMRLHGESINEDVLSRAVLDHVIASVNLLDKTEEKELVIKLLCRQLLKKTCKFKDAEI